MLALHTVLHLKSDNKTGQNDRYKKIKKTHFGGQIWVIVKFDGKNGFKTIILIYPENLGHLDIFLSEKGQLKNFGPLPPQGLLYIKKIIFFQHF